MTPESLMEELERSLDSARAAKHLFNYMKLYGSLAEESHLKETIDLVVRNAICEAGYEARKES